MDYVNLRSGIGEHEIVIVIIIMIMMVDVFACFVSGRWVVVRCKYCKVLC